MVDQGRIQAAVKEILEAVGEDTTREGLIDTPARAARFWAEFIDHDAGRLNTTFSSVSVDQMVVVRGISGWSMCEHHLLPFWYSAAVGYIADDALLGLSKIARIVYKAGSQLQLQERMAEQIADEVSALTGCKDVGVLIVGTHLCMVMRGVKARGAEMVTHVLRGRFRDDWGMRSEFQSLSTSNGAGKL